jgi:transcriptional regulator with XRE-family HTH domain
MKKQLSDAEFLIQMIRRIVCEELGKGNKTPGDYRIAAGYDEPEQLAKAVSADIKLSTDMLRRYERGDVVEIDGRGVAKRLCAIAEKLNVPVLEYRAAVRRMMEARDAKGKA